MKGEMMNTYELQAILNDMYHISGIEATDNAVGLIVEEHDRQAAEIAALTARVERLREALVDIRHGGIGMLPGECEKLYRRIASEALGADDAASGDT